MTIILLIMMALLTAFAVGTLVWLRRPVTPARPTVVEVTRAPCESGPHEPFERAPSEPTEYLPLEQLPVMAALHRREAARVAAIMASPEEATTYVSFEEVVSRLDAASARPAEAILAPEPTGLGSREVEPLLDQAVEAFVAWQAEMAVPDAGLPAIAEGSERRWLDRMAMLAGASEAASHDVFESVLLDRRADTARRTVACLALLARNPMVGLGRIESVVESGDTTVCIDALRCWSSHDADALLVERANRANIRETFWLDRLRERRLDPGPALLDDLLKLDDVGPLRRGLDLLCLHEGGHRHRATIQPHYFAANARIRVAAVRAGVFLHDRTAWLHGRQMATDIDCPGATELIAMLGTRGEQDALFDWAERAGIAGAQVWALALTGRRRAADLANRRLLRGEGDHRVVAALRHVIGDGGDRLALSPECRYLLGEMHDSAGHRICMSRHRVVHRRALAFELLLRSRGACRLRVHGLSSDLARQSNQLDVVEVDTSSGLSWD